MTETSKVMPGEGVEGAAGGAEGGEAAADSPTKEEKPVQPQVSGTIYGVR